MYEYKARIERVIDGDTFELDIDAGFNMHYYTKVRIKDIDCPEKNSRNGEIEKRAGLHVFHWANEKLFWKVVKIKTYKPDSFGRWLVDMYVNWDNDDDDYVNIADTYNAKGFNKMDKNYSLDKLIERIDEIEKAQKEAMERRIMF